MQQSPAEKQKKQTNNISRSDRFLFNTKKIKHILINNWKASKGSSLESSRLTRPEIRAVGAESPGLLQAPAPVPQLQALAALPAPSFRRGGVVGGVGGEGGWWPKGRRGVGGGGGGGWSECKMGCPGQWEEPAQTCGPVPGGDLPRRTLKTQMQQTGCTIDPKCTL